MALQFLRKHLRIRNLGISADDRIDSSIKDDYNANIGVSCGLSGPDLAPMRVNKAGMIECAGPDLSLALKDTQNGSISAAGNATFTPDQLSQYWNFMSLTAEAMYIEFSIDGTNYTHEAYPIGVAGQIISIQAWCNAPKVKIWNLSGSETSTYRITAYSWPEYRTG